jgi:hypothetical protein
MLPVDRAAFRRDFAVKPKLSQLALILAKPPGVLGAGGQENQHEDSDKDGRQALNKAEPNVSQAANVQAKLLTIGCARSR